MKPTQEQVIRFMEINCDQYSNSTQLVEGANAHFNGTLSDELDDETSWIWEIALEFITED